MFSRPPDLLVERLPTEGLQAFLLAAFSSNLKCPLCQYGGLSRVRSLDHETVELSLAQKSHLVAWRHLKPANVEEFPNLVVLTRLVASQVPHKISTSARGTFPGRFQKSAISRRPRSKFKLINFIKLQAVKQISNFQYGLLKTSQPGRGPVENSLPYEALKMIPLRAFPPFSYISANSFCYSQVPCVLEIDNNRWIWPSNLTRHPLCLSPSHSRACLTRVLEHR